MLPRDVQACCVLLCDVFLPLSSPPAEEAIEELTVAFAGGAVSTEEVARVLALGSPNTRSGSLCPTWRDLFLSSLAEEGLDYALSLRPLEERRLRGRERSLLSLICRAETRALSRALTLPSSARTVGEACDENFSRVCPGTDGCFLLAERLPRHLYVADPSPPRVLCLSPEQALRAAATGENPLDGRPLSRQAVLCLRRRLHLDLACRGW